MEVWKGRLALESSLTTPQRLNLESPRVYLCAQVLSSVRSFVTLGLQPTRLLYPRDFSGRNTVVGCHFLLQGMFPTQGSNSCLLCLQQCRWILYLLSHRGRPKLPHDPENLLPNTYPKRIQNIFTQECNQTHTIAQQRKL